MYYKKEETYSFTMPKEREALLQFENDLKSAGVTFSEHSRSQLRTIKIVTTGKFDTQGDQWDIKI